MAKRGLTFTDDQTVPLEDSSPSMLWSKFNNGEDILNTFDTNHKLFIHAYYMAAEKKKEMQKCEIEKKQAKSVERFDKLVLRCNDLREKYDNIVTLIPLISNTITPYKCAMYACAKYKIDDKLYEPKYKQRFDPMITALITLKKNYGIRYNIKDILIDAITYACVKGNLNALQELIDKFKSAIDLGEDDSILVWYNLTNNSIYEWVSGPRGPLSIESGYIKMSLLHIACYYNHLDIVRYLLGVNELNQIEPICDVNGLNQIDLPPIYYACERGHETIVYELLKFIKTNDIFYINVTANNLQELIVYGKDINIGDTIQLSDVVQYHYHHSCKPGYEPGYDQLFTYLKKLENELESLKQERHSDEPDRKKQKTYRQLRF